MLLKFVDSRQRFEFECDFSDKDRAKSAGFRWCPDTKKWWTSDALVAKKLAIHANPGALDALGIEVETRPKVTTAKVIPHPSHLTPYPFQIHEAVPFALERRHAYLGLDMGLGKTVCAALTINAVRTAYPGVKVVYVCPPFLRVNVARELEKWCVGFPSIGILTKTSRGNVFAKLGEKKAAIPTPDIAIVTDSMIARDDVLDQVRSLLSSHPESLLICDEAHRFKGKSQRAEALFEVGAKAGRSLMLSGTPMPNSPSELRGILSTFGPTQFRQQTPNQFYKRYCNPKPSRFHQGYDYSGVSHFAELYQSVVGKYLLRIKKTEVLTDLPERREEVVFLDGSLSAGLKSLEKEILKAASPKDLMRNEVGGEHVATYRRKLGLHKADLVAEYVEALLEGSEESVLLFGVHRDVIAALEAKLKKYNPLIIHGGVDKDIRQDIADKFQRRETRLMILNIAAGGVGLNLTAASRVVFAEASWVPADNAQAIDRAHRIGQKNAVMAEYLTFPASLDAQILQTCLRKNEVTSAF